MEMTKLFMTPSFNVSKLFTTPSFNVSILYFVLFLAELYHFWQHFIILQQVEYCKNLGKADDK